ncbi:hypothetical protein EAAEB30_08815 [Enterobacter asburiae]|nr:hypothetical protein EAAEB30_08815 [Enterobacter asburiae]
MTNLSNKQMIEHLSKFRDAGDKLSEDIYKISVRISEVIDGIQSREDRSEGENIVLQQLTSMSELILASALHSNDYNKSLWKDYTKVIKALGSKQGEISNA